MTGADQTDAVEALAEQICICTGNHDPGLRIECHYALTAARKVITSDWLAAREQAAERRGAVRELRESADDIAENIDWSDGRSHYGDNEGYEHSARVLRERADRIEAES